MYKFGDIVLLPFPFTDLAGHKRRPALLISRDCGGRDLLMCFITTQQIYSPWGTAIDPDAENGLKKRSWLLYDKIATLDRGLITSRLGFLRSSFLYAERVRFYSVFGFEPY